MRRALLATGAVGLTVGLGLVLDAGCSKTVAGGGLEVVIATNLQVPSELDAFELEVSQQTTAGWHQLFDRTFHVPAESPLPTSFSIAAGSSTDQLARVRLIAYKDGKAIDLRLALVQVPTDHVGTLSLVLAESCVGQVEVSQGAVVPTCDAGNSCQPPSGRCGADLIPGTLPDFNPSDVQNVDASVGSFRSPSADAGGRSDAGHTPDAGRRHDAGHVRDAGDAGQMRDAGDAGDACAGGGGCAVVLVPTGARGIAVDSDAVYYCSGVSVFRYVLVDGSTEMVDAVGGEDCDGVALDPDGGSVYWTTPSSGGFPGGVWQVAKYDGGAGNSLGYYKSPTEITVVSKRIYVVDPKAEGVFTLQPEADASFVPLKSPGYVAADPTGVYVTSTVDGGVVVRLGDAGPRPFASGQGTPTGVAVSGGDVYWGRADTPGVIKSENEGPPGTPAVVVTTGGLATGGVATDGTWVYWVSTMPTGAVYAARIGTQEVKTIAAGQDNPNHIAVGPGGVYWTTDSTVMFAPTPQ